MSWRKLGPGLLLLSDPIIKPDVMWPRYLVMAILRVPSCCNPRTTYLINQDEAGVPGRGCMGTYWWGVCVCHRCVLGSMLEPVRVKWVLWTGVCYRGEEILYSIAGLLREKMARMTDRSDLQAFLALFPMTLLVGCCQGRLQMASVVYFNPYMCESVAKCPNVTSGVFPQP